MVSYKKDIEMNVSEVEVVFVVRQHVHDEISLWWLARLQDIYLHASHIHALRVCVCVCVGTNLHAILKLNLSETKSHTEMYIDLVFVCLFLAMLLQP